MINLQKVTLITGMSGILISFFSFSPNALAGSGGMAGSSAFDVNTTVNGVGVSAAVGENGAGAWSFNDSINAAEKNSAGSMGSSSSITIGGVGDEFNASGVGQVINAEDYLVDVDGARVNNGNTGLSGNANLQLGTATDNVIVDSPANP